MKIFSVSVQFSRSVVSDSNPMDCSMPGFPVYHQLPELAQTHVHGVGDAIQPSHPLLSPSPPAFNLSQHQSFPMSQFFASGGQSIGVLASAPVFPMNIQDCFPLGWTGWISGIGKMSFLYYVKDAVITGTLSHRFAAPLVPLSSNIQLRSMVLIFREHGLHLFPCKALFTKYTGVCQLALHILISVPALCSWTLSFIFCLCC